MTSDEALPMPEDEAPRYGMDPEIEYSSGFFDGLVAGRAALINKAQSELARYDLAVDTDGVVTSAPGPLRIKDQPVRGEDNPLGDDDYASGFEDGFAESWQIHLRRVRAQVVEQDLIMSDEANVLTASAASIFIDAMAASKAQDDSANALTDKALHQFLDADDSGEDFVATDEDDDDPAEAWKQASPEVADEDLEPAIVSASSGATTPSLGEPIAATPLDATPRRPLNRRSLFSHLTTALLGASAATSAFLFTRSPPGSPNTQLASGWSPPRTWDNFPPFYRNIFLLIDEWVYMKEASNNAPVVHGVVLSVMTNSGIDQLKNYVVSYLGDTLRGAYTNDLLPGLAPAAGAAPAVRRGIIGLIEDLWNRQGLAACNLATKTGLQSALATETDPTTIGILNRVIQSFTQGGL